MTGVLCGKRKEKRLARALARRMTEGEGNELLVFSLQGLDLTRRTARGTLVTASGVRPALCPLPAVIANLSAQRAAGGRRLLRALRELPGVTLLNPANTFDQRAVRAMLCSCPKLKRCLPEAAPGGETRGGLLLRPVRGENLRRVLYLRRPVSGGMPQTDGRERLRVPPLLAGENGILILRAYLCKGAGDRWHVCLRTAEGPAGEEKTGKSLPAARGIPLAAARCISRYLPDLAFCTVDLVFGEDGGPYFLGLGGWQGLAACGRPRRRLIAALRRVLAGYETPARPMRGPGRRKTGRQASESE